MTKFIKATVVIFHPLDHSTTLGICSTRSVSNNLVLQVASHYSHACISITNLDYLFDKPGGNGRKIRS